MLFNEELLATLPPKIREELSYRMPMRITEKSCYYAGYENAQKVYYDFAVCPHCKASIEREYQSFCDNCGQKLDWKGYGKIKAKTWEERQKKREGEKK